jgi:hypothetical protein
VALVMTHFLEAFVFSNRSAATMFSAALLLVTKPSVAMSQTPKPAAAARP